MAVKADSSVSLESLPQAAKVQVLFRDGFICSLLQHYNGRHYKPLSFLIAIFQSSKLSVTLWKGSVSV